MKIKSRTQNNTEYLNNLGKLIQEADKNTIKLNYFGKYIDLGKFQKLINENTSSRTS